jgi:hypothetical protein
MILTMTTPRTPGFNVDDLPTPSTPLLDRSLLENFELIQDLARYGQNLLTRDQVKKRWRKLITEEMWETLGSNDELVDRIEAEKVRRVRDGSFKRERAQQHVVAAPDILNEIMTDPKQSAKHRIDSAKALDQFTGNPAEAEQRDRIVIKIDLSADTKNPNDVLVFEAVKPNPSTTIDSTTQEIPHQQEPTAPVKRRLGRPPGSKNKPKELKQGDDSGEPL